MIGYSIVIITASNMAPPIRHPTLSIQHFGVDWQRWAIKLNDHMCPYLLMAKT